MSTYGFTISVDGDAREQMAKINLALEGMGAKATVETKKVQSAFTHMGEHVKGMMSSLKGFILPTLGIGAAFEGFEFIKKGSEEFEQLKIASAEVKTGLQSTANAAGIAFEDISRVTEGLFKSTLFTKAQLMDMQSLLVTFPGVTKQAFGTASQAIADMAQRMHQDLKTTTIQVGKALQDPIKGAAALRRVGVALSEEQLEKVKDLVNAGKKYEAQQMIMNELQTEFAGSAKTAFDATPLAEFHKSMEELQEDIGKTIDRIKTSMGPVVNDIFEKLKKGAEDLKPFATAIYTPFKELFGKIASDTSGWGDYLKIAANVWTESIEPSIINIAQNIAKAWGDTIEFISNSEILKGVWSGIGEVTEEFVELLSEAFSIVGELYDELKPILDELEDFWNFFNSEEEEAERVRKQNDRGTPEEKNRLAGLYYLNHGLSTAAAGGRSGASGSAMAQSSINTSELGGAKGGLGEAKVINIKIETMQKIENITGLKDLKNASEDAIGVLVRALNNISHSQSGTM